MSLLSQVCFLFAKVGQHSVRDNYLVLSFKIPEITHSVFLTFREQGHPTTRTACRRVTEPSSPPAACSGGPPLSRSAQSQPPQWKRHRGSSATEAAPSPSRYTTRATNGFNSSRIPIEYSIVGKRVASIPF